MGCHNFFLSLSLKGLQQQEALNRINKSCSSPNMISPVLSKVGGWPFVIGVASGCRVSSWSVCTEIPSDDESHFTSPLLHLILSSTRGSSAVSAVITRDACLSGVSFGCLGLTLPCWMKLGPLCRCTRTHPTNFCNSVFLNTRFI